MIEVKHLKKHFGTTQKIEVLHDLTVKFPEKGLVVLLGKSGSGKTTFLNIIGGLEKPSSGDILYEGHLIKQNGLNFDMLRNRSLGYIFQNYHLLPNQSVYDNVALALRILGYKDEKEIEKRVLYTLRAVQMHHFRARIVSQLSGGQQQRVAIARALVKNPKVILADEPTGNLDSKHTYEIMHIIKKISEEKLVIWVSHERELVNHFADRIIEVKDGKILSNQENSEKGQYTIDDHTLFIKDFKADKRVDDAHWNLSLYREKESEAQHEVTLIVRNNTLYVDTDPSIQNVRIIRQENQINIEKELTQEAFNQQQTTIDFDQNELAHDDTHRLKPFISIKKILIDAIKGVFQASKKTNLMLTVFFLMGMMIALGIPFINNVNSNRMIFPSDQRQYIQVSGMISSGANYRIMESLSVDDASFYINVFRPSNITFDITSVDEQLTPQLNVQYGLTRHLSSDQLVYGRLPETPYEMAIDLSIILADYQRQSSTLRRAGIWEFEQIVGRKIKNLYIDDQPFVITGVVNSGARRVFVNDESVVFLASHYGFELLAVEYFMDLPNFNIERGRIPSAYDANRGYYEVLVPSSLVDRYPGLTTHDFSEIETFEIDFNIYATGIYHYDDLSFHQVILLPHQDVSFRIFQYTVTQVNVFVYTNNPQGMILSLENTFNNAQMSWPYQIAQDEGRIFLLGIRTLMTIGVLLIILSFISIYFILKSVLSHEIQEIAIYRALGVRKKDIVLKYGIETMVRLTATATFGYILLTIFVNQIDSALLGGSYYFLVTLGSFFIGLGLIYLIGFLGMIPLFQVLQKSPARLLSYDDI